MAPSTVPPSGRNEKAGVGGSAEPLRLWGARSTRNRPWGWAETYVTTPRSAATKLRTHPLPVHPSPRLLLHPQTGTHGARRNHRPHPHPLPPHRRHPQEEKKVRSCVETTHASRKILTCEHLRKKKPPTASSLIAVHTLRISQNPITQPPPPSCSSGGGGQAGHR